MNVLGRSFECCVVGYVVVDDKDTKERRNGGVWKEREKFERRKNVECLEKRE